MTELLPCPFCGGRIEFWNTGSATGAGPDVEVVHVEADKRKCIMDEMYLGREDKAYDLWNTRHPKGGG